MSVLFQLLDEEFVIDHLGRAMWSYGSCCACGGSIYVSHVGKGYKVVTHAWSYDCDGECVYDIRAEYYFRRHKDVIALVNEFKGNK